MQRINFCWTYWVDRIRFRSRESVSILSVTVIYAFFYQFVVSSLFHKFHNLLAPLQVAASTQQSCSREGVGTFLREFEVVSWSPRVRLRRALSTVTITNVICQACTERTNLTW